MLLSDHVIKQLLLNEQLLNNRLLNEMVPQEQQSLNIVEVILSHTKMVFGCC